MENGPDVRANTFLVLDLRLDGGDGVAALDLEDDGLPRHRLHEDLHHLLHRDLTHPVLPSSPPSPPSRALAFWLDG